MRKITVLFFVITLLTSLNQCKNNENNDDIFSFLLAKQGLEYLKEPAKKISISSNGETSDLEFKRFGALVAEETAQKIKQKSIVSGQSRSESGTSDSQPAIDINEVEVDSTVIQAGEDATVWVQFEKLNVVESEGSSIELSEETAASVTLNRGDSVYELENTCSMRYDYQEIDETLEFDLTGCVLKDPESNDTVTLDIALEIDGTEPGQKSNRVFSVSPTTPNYKKGSSKPDLGVLIYDLCKYRVVSRKRGEYINSCVRWDTVSYHSDCFKDYKRKEEVNTCH